MSDSIKLHPTELSDRLRRFQPDFELDFEYRDVILDLKLSKDGLRWILQDNSSEKIDGFIFYYIYKAKDVEQFLNAIQKSYSWIYDKILTASNDKWINDYRSAIHDIPNHQDWNVHRTEYLWKIQKNLKELKRGNYLVLCGKPGFGKRWLAVDACRDYSVIYNMGFKIYWLNVSKCNTLELILDKLHRLKVLLNVDDSDSKYYEYSGNTKNEIYHMNIYLRKILESPSYKDCLIVLTDVKDENVVKAFNLNCKMLLTTKHKGKLEFLAKDRHNIIDIDTGFTTTESCELFLKTFKDKRSELPEDMKKFVSTAHERCSGHPFIMSLIAKTFQNSNDADNDRLERFDNWLKNLDSYKIYDYDKQIQMSVEESIKFLDESQFERYKRMVVFTDNIEVPLDVLAKLWDKDQQCTELLVEKLQKLSLIEKQMNGTCSLHYLHFMYLKEEVSEESQITYHQLLLDKYNVEKIYHNRGCLELDYPNDNYFYFYIGYHLFGAKKFDLFDMYLDFGFLEQKIRIAKLANTLGDLRKFQNEIHRNDEYRQELLEEIWLFMSTIEQFLYKSRDTTLLQYALTNEGLIKVEAQKQATRFDDRVWLNDNNHLKLENQIIALQDGLQPRIVRFVRSTERDDLVCLISLHDNNIILQDIATDYANKPILYKNDLFQHTIIDMQIFRHHAFLVLNDTGKLSVYNLKWSNIRRPSVPIRLNSNDSSADRYPFVIENKRSKFSCFSIAEYENKYNVDLIVGTTSGNLKLYKWLPKMNKFEDIKSDIRTGFNDLFRMAHINDYVMLINTKGDIGFRDLINSSMLVFEIELKLENPVNLHQGTCSNLNVPITVCVSSDKVIQITHENERTFPNLPLIQIKSHDIFKAVNDFDENTILSSAVSKDFLYIVLGTAKGIIVIDRIEKKVVSRRSVSDQVISLDIYRDEETYLFLSVFKDAGQLINLHSFKHDDSAMIKHLVGDEMFDVDKNHDNWRLVALDSKNCIQQFNSSNDFAKTDSEFSFKFQITKICYFNDNEILVGCTNGEIHQVFNMNIDKNSHKIDQLTCEITYLENFNGTVIISSNCSYKILGMPHRNGKITKAYQYDENTLLVIKKDCSIELIDTRTKEVVAMNELLDENSTCVAQAYCNELLALGTVRKNNIYLWNLDDLNAENSHIRSIENQLDSEISFISISPDKSILAVGCFNGNIEIFDLAELVPMATLESHKRPILNMIFSPWLENRGPLILLSISSSINFWNITHIQNNRRSITRSVSGSDRTRVSKRFQLPFKILSRSEDTVDTSFKNLTLSENGWSHKTGPQNKPELLTSIKFIGKSAKKVVVNDDFTRFLTIDNEGNVYNLKLIEQSNNHQIAIDSNESPLIDFE